VHWILADLVHLIGGVDDRLVRTFDPMIKLVHSVSGSVLLRWTARVIWALLMVLHHRGPWLVPIRLVAATLLLVIVFGREEFRFLVPVVLFLSVWVWPA
jgi:hypothetical protein